MSTYQSLLEERFNMTKEDAHTYLDMAQTGLWVHPVTLTVALVLTGDLDISQTGETYEELFEDGLAGTV